MENFLKNRFVTILIVSATVVLAGIAIFTAIRLYQLRKESISPGAPESKPGAQEGQMCGGIAGLICASGYVCTYEDGSTRAPYPDASGTCQKKDEFSHCTPLQFTIKKMGTPTPTPQEVGCGSTCQTDFDCGASVTSSSTTELICYQPPMPTCPPGQKCIDVMPPKVCRNVDCPEDADCECAIGGGTATPTPTPEPTSTPTRSPTPTATPKITATPIETPSLTEEPTLPEAGISYPTVLGVGIGVILLILSLALAL